MRLTNTLREQFVLAILRQLPPVPSFDFEAWETQFRSAMEAGLPAPVLAFAREYPHYISRQSNRDIRFCERLDNRAFCPRRGWRRDRNKKYCHPRMLIWTLFGASSAPPPDLDAHAKAAYQTFLAAADEREALAKRLEEVAAACTTTEALAKAFPEFAHLVPEPIAPRKLPVAIQTNQLVADLVKAGLKLEATD